MKLPEDIRLEIEKSEDREDILLLLARLESDGVAITHDVYAAIVATLEYTKLGPIEEICMRPPKPQLCRARGQTSERFQSWTAQNREEAIMLRIIHGKLKPGTWDSYERAYKNVTAEAGKITGLRGR